MTMTSTDPTADVGNAAHEVAEHGAGAQPTVRPYAAPTGLAAWLTTTDHKRIGRMYAGFALLFALGALVIGALLAADRIDDSAAFLRLHSVGQFLALYRFVLAFGVVVPLLLGIGIAIVPLQIGAQGIAFPRAAALSFWGWLMGTGLMIGAIASDGGPGGVHPRAVDLFLASLALLVASLIVGCICLVTTVLTLRPPGMRLERVPAFTWSIFVTASMLLLSLPVLLAAVVLLAVDNRYGQVAFQGSGGIAGILDWAVSQPQTFLYAVPALGFVADVIPTFTKTRLQLRPVVFVGIALAAILGFGADVQTAFNGEVHHQFLFLAGGLALVLPVLIVLGASALSLRQGKVTAGAPLVFAVLAALVLLAGAAAGALSGWRGLNLDGTVYGFGQSNLVLGAGLVAGLGALVYWWPKLTGRALAGGLANLVALLAAGGAILLGGADIVLGFAKQPFGEVNDLGTNLSSSFNTVSMIGYILLFVAVLAAVELMIMASRKGGAAGDDPWDGQTLEWATTSPPADVNFPEPVGAVTSAEPLLDLKLAGKDA